MYCIMCKFRITLTEWVYSNWVVWYTCTYRSLSHNFLPQPGLSFNCITSAYARSISYTWSCTFIHYFTDSEEVRWTSTFLGQKGMQHVNTYIETTQLLADMTIELCILYNRQCYSQWQSACIIHPCMVDVKQYASMDSIRRFTEAVLAACAGATCACL